MEYRPTILPGPGVYGRARYRDITGAVVRVEPAYRRGCPQPIPRIWITIWPDKAKAADRYDEITVWHDAVEWL